MLWRRLLLGLSIVLNLVLAYSLVWGQKGIVSYRELKEQCSVLERKIQAHDRDNLALSREIRLLQADEKYLEKVIRNRLNYVRDNEILYIFPDASQRGYSGVPSYETEN